MKIENINRQLEEAKTSGQSICSDPHLICGFKMRSKVFLNGNGIGKGTHMSVFLQLMKGKFDDCMGWPFDKLATFVLIHQDDKKKCYRRSFNDTQKQKDTWTSFQKPVTDVNTAVGLQDYITLEKLRADGFIKNDILYIRTFIK